MFFSYILYIILYIYMSNIFFLVIFFVCLVTIIGKFCKIIFNEGTM